MMRRLALFLLALLLVPAGLALVIVIAGDFLFDRQQLRDPLIARLEEQTHWQWHIGAGPRIRWQPLPHIILSQVEIFDSNHPQQPHLHADEVLLEFPWNALFNLQLQVERLKARQLIGELTPSSNPASPVHSLAYRFAFDEVELLPGSTRLRTPQPSPGSMSFIGVALRLGNLSISRGERNWQWPETSLTGDLHLHHQRDALRLENLRLLVRDLRIGGTLYARSTPESVVASGHVAVDPADLRAWLQQSLTQSDRQPNTIVPHPSISEQGFRSLAAGIDFQLHYQRVSHAPWWLKLDFLAEDFYAGQVAGFLQFRPLDAGDTRLRLSTHASGIEIEPLLADLQAKLPITGVANIGLELKAMGGGWERIRDSLGGDARLSLREVQLKAAVLEEILAAKELNFETTGNEWPQLPVFRDISASFQGSSGIFRSQDVMARSPQVVISGRGIVDLAAETMDFDLTAVLQDNPEVSGLKELTGLQIPVRIQGDWLAPQVSANPVPTLREAAARALKQKAKEHQDKLRAIEQRTGIPGLEKGLRQLLGAE